MDRFEEIKRRWSGPGRTTMPPDVERLVSELERLQEALRQIAESEHQQYEVAGSGSYGIGVADGHRCAANVARAALGGR